MYVVTNTIILDYVVEKVGQSNLTVKAVMRIWIHKGLLSGPGSRSYWGPDPSKQKKLYTDLNLYQINFYSKIPVT